MSSKPWVSDGVPSSSFADQRHVDWCRVQGKAAAVALAVAAARNRMRCSLLISLQGDQIGPASVAHSSPPPLKMISPLERTAQWRRLLPVWLSRGASRRSLPSLCIYAVVIGAPIFVVTRAGDQSAFGALRSLGLWCLRWQRLPRSDKLPIYRFWQVRIISCRKRLFAKFGSCGQT